MQKKKTTQKNDLTVSSSMFNPTDSESNFLRKEECLKVFIAIQLTVSEIKNGFQCRTSV